MSSKPRYFFASITGLTLLSVLSYFMMYYLDVYIANMLGPKDFGSIKVKLRLIHNAAHILLLGQDGIILIYLQRYQNNPKLLGGFVRWMHRTILERMMLIWCVCLAVILWGYYHPVPESESWIAWGLWLTFVPLILFRLSGNFFGFRQRPLMQRIMLLLGIGVASALLGYQIGPYNENWVSWSLWLAFVPWVLLFSYLDRFFLYLKHYYASYIPRNIANPLLYFALLSMLYRPNENNMLMCYGLSIILLCLYRLLRYKLCALPSGEETPEAHGEWWTQSRHYWSSVITLQSSRSVNLYLLGALATNQREVGYFSAILTVVLSLYILTKSVENYLKPWVATYETDRVNFLSILRYCNHIRLIQVVFLWGLVMIFAENIMQQFGSDYVEYSHALRVLMSCYSLYTLGQPNFDLLNFSGYSNDSSKIMTFKFLAMLILAILLIPSYGLWGCLFADGLTSVLATILATLQCKQRLGFHGWLR